MAAAERAREREEDPRPRWGELGGQRNGQSVGKWCLRLYGAYSQQHNTPRVHDYHTVESTRVNGGNIAKRNDRSLARSASTYRELLQSALARFPRTGPWPTGRPSLRPKRFFSEANSAPRAIPSSSSSILSPFPSRHCGPAAPPTC